jgi:hypothetical protein
METSEIKLANVQVTTITLENNTPGIGYSYDAEADVFIAPRPFASWSLDENFDWQAPVARPEEGFWTVGRRYNNLGRTTSRVKKTGIKEVAVKRAVTSTSIANSFKMSVGQSSAAIPDTPTIGTATATGSFICYCCIYCCYFRC